MPELHHSLGTSGLRLRTERGVQVLALTNNGPLLDGAYATTAELEAAEAGRVVAEIALDTPGALCLAVDDGGTLLPREAGDPNPQYTLYRVARVPQEGTEPPIIYGHSERLEAMADPCDFGQLWQVTQPTVAAAADDALDSATGWTIGAPKLVGSANDALDSRTGWTIDPDALPSSGSTTPSDLGQTTGGAVDSGADRTYTDDTAANWAVAAANGWQPLVRLWLNSSGPYTMNGIAVEVRDWHAIWPTARFGKLDGSLLGAPYYWRAEGNGKGAIYTREPATTIASELHAGAQVNWNPAQAWTIFAVATAYPLTAEQCVLFEAGPIGAPAPGTPLTSLAIHSGTTTAGMRLALGTQASRTFSAPLSTGPLKIIEAHAATGATVGAFALAINGTEQAEAAVSNGTLVPQWQYPPDDFAIFGGRTGKHLFGGCAELLLLQTDDPAIRTKVRQYLAAKFAITIA